MLVLKHYDELADEVEVSPERVPLNGAPYAKTPTSVGVIILALFPSFLWNSSLLFLRAAVLSHRLTLFT